MLSLFVYLSDGEPQTMPLTDPGSITVGRTESCDLQLIDPCVSSQHCRFEGRAGRYWLTDLDSRNGTTVNGKTVSRWELRRGDTVRVGRTRIVFGDERTAEMLRYDPTTLVGQRVKQYQVMQIMSQSDLGTNLLAVDEAMSRNVMMKVLPPQMILQKELIKRFSRQAQLGENIEHPNVAATYDVGSCGPFHYLVSEHVDGVTLGQWMADNYPVLPATVVDIGTQIAAALAYLGEQKVVHRNLNPANVYVRSDGIVKLADLWLAKNLSRKMASSVTGPGQVLGNLTYMPPEQLSDTASVDARADIYALGAILFQMLCGAPPFVGETNQELVQMIKHNEPPDPRHFSPSVPPRLAQTILKALAKEPKRRHGKAAQVRKELVVIGRDLETMRTD